MVLKTLGVTSLDLPTLQTLCSTTSVWTVDLAHLLRHFGLDVTLATIMVGANPSYYHEDFYMEHMAEDQFRVTQLFKEAEQAGIVIQQKSIPLKKLQESMLCGKHLIIALVDKRRLCSNVVWGTAPALQRSSANCLSTMCGCGGAYTGHYVVLCGYNADTDAFLVQDPAAGCCHISVPSATFEYARKAWGTDEDLLVVPLNQRRVPTASVHEVQVYGRCT